MVAGREVKLEEDGKGDTFPKRVNFGTIITATSGAWG
jgi:hypothetical protein